MKNKYLWIKWKKRNIFDYEQKKIQLRVARHKPNEEYNFSSERAICVFFFIEIFFGDDEKWENIHELLQPLWYVEWKQQHRERKLILPSEKK